MGIMARQIRPGQLQENVLYNISASYAISASHETTHEVSSSYAETASFAVTASHLLNNPPAFPFTGDAEITGSLVVSGTVEFRGNENTSTNVVIGPVLGATSANTVVIGNGAGIAFGGQRNVAIGDSAILANNTSFGVALGHSANVTGTNGIALGYSTVAQNGIAIGRDAEANGVGAIAIGRSIIAAEDQLRIGDENVVISASLETGDIIISGSISSSRSNSTASFGTYTGDGSQLTGISTTPFPFTGDAVITGSLTITGSFHSFVLDSDNIVLGEGAGGSMIATADNNVVLGTDAAGETSYNFSGDGNVVVGHQAGFKLSTGGNNVLIGLEAGKLVDNDSSNVFLGTYAGRYQNSGNTSISVGYNALRGGSGAGSTSTGNIAIGYRAGEVVNGAIYNNMMGFLAGVSLSTGDYNTLLGYYAGSSITTGNGNIIIGSGSTGESAISNQLRIGNGNTITTISASLETGDIIFASTASAEYLSTPAGNLSSISASYALTASHALNSGGGAGIFSDVDGYKQTINNLIISESNASSSLSIINSGSTIFDVQGSVGQLFEVADGLDGVLMSVNDISGIPILTVSSSGDVFLAAGSTLQGTAATASYVAGVSAAFPFTGSAAISGSLNINGSGSGIFDVDGTVGSLFSVNDGLDGILMSVNDISGLPLFEVSSSGDVEINSGNISGSSTSTASFGTYIGDGSQLTGLPSPTFISSGSTSASAAPNTGVVVEHSGSTAFSVIGDVGTLFAIDDDLTGTLLSVNDISGIPQLEVSASGLVELSKGPLIANSFATGSAANGAPSSPLQMTIPSASSAQLFGVGGYFRASWDDGDSDHIWFEDDNIRLSYDLSGVDIEGTIMTDPASGEIHISLDKDGTRTALDKQVSDGIFDLNAVIGTDQTDRYIFAAPTDPTWPYYKIEVTRTSATHGSGFYAIVEKFI